MDTNDDDESVEKIDDQVGLWTYRFVGVIFLILLAICVESATDIIKYHRVMNNWQESRGTVTALSTEADSVEVEYEYRANGALLSSDCGTYDCNALDEEWEEQLEVGAQVDVYFNPSSPREAFLAYPKPSLSEGVAIVLLSILSLVGMGLMFSRMGDRTDRMIWRAWTDRFGDLKAWLDSRRR